MKIRRTFPIRDYVDVDCGELGTIQVKFKDPTVEQFKLMTKIPEAAHIAYCQYCVADIKGLEDEKGVPIEIELVRGPYGLELPAGILQGLVYAGVSASIATTYHEHFALSETDKKK